jgi:glutathione synthase/RimK-type ligase-like ATP-grasp enzyme
VNTDLFPAEVQLAAEFDRNRQPHYYLLNDGEEIDAEDISAVWLRRIWTPKMSPQLSPQFSESCIRESMTTLNNFWDSMRRAQWIDRMDAVRNAENKLLQLRLASQLGLAIPRTIVTNSPDRLRQFYRSLGTRMVAKLLTPLSTGMAGSSFFAYTSEVQPEDLLAADTLRHSPMVFQELIPKRREFRAICVGDRIFVGALDARTYEGITLDWRTSPDSTWEPYTLPDRVVSLLQAMLTELGLVFGAFDLIQTPDDEYVFLEINPSGEWGMLERDLDYPIAGAIADRLAHTRS